MELLSINNIIPATGWYAVFLDGNGVSFEHPIVCWAHVTVDIPCHEFKEKPGETPASREGTMRRLDIITGMVVDPDGKSIVAVEGIPDFQEYVHTREGLGMKIGRPLPGIPLPGIPLKGLEDLHRELGKPEILHREPGDSKNSSPPE